MLRDIVLDTNVLVHAGKAAELLGAISEKLVIALKARMTKICVDDGFDVETARNRSVVGHEYLTHLRSGSVGHSFVMYMAQTGRVRIVSKQVNPALARKINQRIVNKKDRTFLRVTLNSEERVLVSHDYTDFSQEKRDTFCSGLGTTVCSATEAFPIAVEN